jgi:hypothetical protein
MTMHAYSTALLCAALLYGHSVQATQMSDSSKQAKVAVDDGGLLASAPEAALAGQLRLYGQFVGDWDLVATNYSAGGAATTRRGEWNFRWVLEGRAVQDVFIVPARGAREDAGSAGKQSYGTTLRFYDPQRDLWEITYVDPVYTAVFRMTARFENGEIVQTGVDHQGRTYRWIFFDVRPNSFRWRSEVLQSNRKTWVKEQDFSATRKKPHAY